MKGNYSVIKLKINKMDDLTSGETVWYYAGEDCGGYNKELITKDINKAKVFEKDIPTFELNSFYNTFEDIDNEYECFRLDDIVIKSEEIRVSRETVVITKPDSTHAPQATPKTGIVLGYSELLTSEPDRTLIIKQGVRCTKYDLQTHIDSSTGLLFLDENETVDRYLILKSVNVKGYNGYKISKDMKNINSVNKGHGKFYSLTPYIGNEDLTLYLTIDWNPDTKIIFIEIAGSDEQKAIWEHYLESIELAFTVISK